MNIEDLDLRKAIMVKMSGSSADDIEATIKDAVESGDEKTLPGLGVLFELLWQDSESGEKQEMITHIHNGIQQDDTAQVGEAKF